MKERIRQFCAQKEELAYQTEQEFQKYYRSIEELMEKIRKVYRFHGYMLFGFKRHLKKD